MGDVGHLDISDFHNLSQEEINDRLSAFTLRKEAERHVEMFSVGIAQAELSVAIRFMKRTENGLYLGTYQHQWEMVVLFPQALPSVPMPLWKTLSST